jgi:sulfate permease, SulP family
MLTKIFPFVIWFQGYTITKFRADFVAGLTVALVLVPQSMAYAQLASLPAYYGLYAAFLPPMVASLFGSSRQLATGPVAMVSLMTAAALEPLATAGTEAFVAYAIMLCFMVGLFQFLLGVFRLGIVINFISHPIVNGFTNAGALIIATSQLQNFLGTNIEKAPHHYQTVYRVIESACQYIHWPTLLLALLALFIMIFLKYLSPKVPYVLVAVCVTTLISWWSGFEQKKQITVNEIKSVDIREDIVSLNRSLALIDSMSEERRDFDRRLANAERRERPFSEIIDLRHNHALLDMHIDELKKQSTKLRGQLKGSLLKAIATDDGRMYYYARQDIPPEIDVQYAVWRLSVGNNPIDEQRITVMGGGKVVGNIPQGLPTIGFPKIDFFALASLLPMVIIISLIGFMEAIAVAKAIAAKTGQRLNTNQELIGQGLSNIIGSFGKSYPVSGSFSRSAVNFQVGAVTGFSGVITSGMVVIALLFFTPLMYHLPQSVLAAIIMMAVLGLLNVSGFVHAWRAKKFDGIVTAVTFVCTLGFAPDLEYGILAGVMLTLIESLFGHMHPDIAVLSKHEDGSFRNAKRWNLKQCRFIGVIRFNGSLFFASASYLEDQVFDEVETMPDLEHIVLVCNGINELDATGVESLTALVRWLREHHIEVVISGINDTIMDVFKRTHLIDLIGEDNFYRNVQRALDAIHAGVHYKTDETVCPLIEVCVEESGLIEDGNKAT